VNSPVWNRGLAQAKGITPPLAGIFDSPASAALVNEKWKPLIISALAQLANNEHLWESGYVFGSDEIAKLIECLIVGDCLEVGAEESNGCIEILPDSGFIEFYPSNPFTQPGYVPMPYQHHPFNLGDHPLMTGLDPTDVIAPYTSIIPSLTDIPGLVPELVTWGFSQIDDLDAWLNLSVDNTNNLFPRFKLRFSGKGEVELHLLKIPFGGMAFILLDGQLPGKFLNMSKLDPFDFDTWKSLLGTIGLGFIAGTLFEEFIYEVKVETEGDHVIDVIFIPSVDYVPPDISIGWGAGLRKITLCGGDMQPVINFEPEFRIEDCILQWRRSVNAEWISLGNVCGADGKDGKDGAAGGCSDCDECDDQDCDDCESEDCDDVC
jgi:hypothetical protein